MATSKSIIEVNISRETKGVSRKGFGTPLFIGNTQGVIGARERVRSYLNLEGVAADFDEGTPELIAASRFFGQQVSPTVIKIGTHYPESITKVDYDVVASDTTSYEIEVDGSTFTYTSSAGDTEQDIIEGLRSDFVDKGIGGSFEFSGTDNTFTIIPEDPSTFSQATTTTQLTDIEITESLGDAYNDIALVDSDFYFVTSYTHDPEGIESLANVVQSTGRFYAASYKGRDALDAREEGDIGSILQSRELFRTFLIYPENVDEFPECAIVGLQSPKDPGSTTMKFRTVTGVTPSKLTTTQDLVLKGSKYDYGKGYNTYSDVGGRTIFQEGRMVNGEFADIIRFSDWIEARIRERVYMTLVNSEKIPYSKAGFAIIEGRITEILSQGVAVGGLIPGFEVTVPNPRKASPNDRANRVASGFEFTATLAGAVHFVSIKGTLTI